MTDKRRQLELALNVLINTPETADYLQANDPRAYEQAVLALAQTKIEKYEERKQKLLSHFGISLKTLNSLSWM